MKTFFLFLYLLVVAASSSQAWQTAIPLVDYYSFSARIAAIRSHVLWITASTCRTPVDKTLLLLGIDIRTGRVIRRTENTATTGHWPHRGQYSFMSISWFTVHGFSSTGQSIFTINSTGKPRAAVNWPPLAASIDLTQNSLDIGISQYDTWGRLARYGTIGTSGYDSPDAIVIRDDTVLISGSIRSSGEGDGLGWISALCRKTFKKTWDHIEPDMNELSAVAIRGPVIYSAGSWGLHLFHARGYRIYRYTTSGRRLTPLVFQRDRLGVRIRKILTLPGNLLLVVGEDYNCKCFLELSAGSRSLGIKRLKYSISDTTFDNEYIYLTKNTQEPFAKTYLLIQRLKLREIWK